MKIVHITTEHRRHDTRILLKQCVSLAAAGHMVHLVVADGKGPETFKGVEIVDVGRPATRFQRFLGAPWRVSRQAFRARADAIHFHDGWLLPFALCLVLLGRRVVYDVHEDYPRDVMNWRFARPVRLAFSFAYVVLEWVGGFLFRRIVAATPHIAGRFPAHKTVTVQNFPITEELSAPAFVRDGQGSGRFVYIGAITVDRGIREMVDAVSRLGRQDLSVELAGSFEPISLFDELAQRPGWEFVRYHGWLGREEIASMLKGVGAGLVVLHPRDNYILSYPIKLFEYMAAGLPVIASDFPLWRGIVEDAGCGLLVDPLDPYAIAGAMQWLLDNPREARDMGSRGRQAVLDHYNWDREAEKLLACYRSLAEEIEAGRARG